VDRVDNISKFRYNSGIEQQWKRKLIMDSFVIVRENGDKYWYVNGKLSRDDGPAVEWARGDKFWYLNGKAHRVDGPAEVTFEGDKTWYVNGKLHRVDGPAVEYVDGDKFWFIDGVEVNIN